MKELHFDELRKDWIANGNFMARSIQRQLRAHVPLTCFVGFPRHWLPIFEWSGTPWGYTVEPDVFVPLISGRTEKQILNDIRRARQAGQLRLLVDVVASAEVVLSETLQRIDGRLAARDFSREIGAELRLTTWHSYNRADVREIDSLIAGFRQSARGVVFIPCAKGRPYHESPGHKRLMRTARDKGVDVDAFDKIVITSIGPIPEAYWTSAIVQSYDTGIRDIYRLYLQTKMLLKSTDYREAWDLMSFAPYSDILRMIHLEGILPELKRIPKIHRRNLPIYRMPTASKS